MGLVGMVWNGFKWLFQFLALPWTKLRGSRHFSTIMRWTLHIVGLMLVLVTLALMNHVLDLEKVLRVPVPTLRKIWLPLLFSLVYLLAWQGWRLWQLVREGAEPSAFPDLDDAWKEATGRLEQSGIDVSATPLFLILGRPAGREVNLFNASGISLTVPLVPREADAPLRVCANPDGIYVTCSDASLLGSYAALLAEATADAQAQHGRHEASRPTRPAAASSNGWNLDPTPLVHGAGDVGGEISNEATAVAVADPPRAATVAVDAAKRQARLLNAEQVERQLARLRHLCDLIVASRRPYCPLNGIVVLVPLRATDNETEANHFATLLEQDLNTVADAMQVRCPLVVSVCDLEQLPGCSELLRRFPEEQRQRRLGLQFPRVAPCDAAAIPGMIEQGIRWIVTGLIPPLVYRLFNVAQHARPDANDAVCRGNEQLYRFDQEIRARESSLARIVLRGIYAGGRGPWLLGGCYLAATGSDVAREQGFAGELFPQLLESQNYVAWTDRAERENARYRRWTVAGYIGVGVFVVGVFTLACCL